MEFFSFVRAATAEASFLTLVILEAAALLSVPSVLLRRRGRPSAALSWLMTLFALPAFGVLLWWAFGRTRIERRLRSHARSRQDFVQARGEIPLAEKNALDSIFAGLLPLRAVGINAFTSTNNHVELLTDGRTAFDRIESEIRAARESVHLLYYIFELDETGQRLIELLIERARAGVQVKVLVDGFGSAKTLHALKKRLEPEGIQFAVFLRSRLYPLYAPRFNFINHRKIIVIDSKRGFCGGMNIADDYRLFWRDLMLFVEGPAVLGLSHVLLEDWYFATQELVEDPEIPPVSALPHAAVDLAVVSSGPDTEAWIHDAYFTAITSAQSRLFLATPYFIPPAPILTALRTAAGRGVDVRIVLPKRSDVSSVKWAGRSFYPMLTEAGVRIFEYNGPMLHAKALVMDDDIISVGSANIDNRSLRLNFEIGLFACDEQLNQQLSSWLEGLFTASDEITSEQLEQKSLLRKLLESAAHLFSPLL